MDCLTPNLFQPVDCASVSPELCEPLSYCSMHLWTTTALLQSRAAEILHREQVIDCGVKEAGPDYLPHETVRTKAISGVETS